MKRNMDSWSNRRAGFTQRDLIVTLVLSFLLLSLFVPWVFQAREQARGEQCKDRLRQIGVCLQTFSYADEQGRFCTGAFDYLRDGSPDEFGWVADVRKSGLSDSLLCPDNPLLGSETLSDWLTGTPAADGSVLPLDRVGVGALHNQWASASERDRKKMAAQAVGSGLNTNYASSWFMVRGGLLMQSPPSDPTGVNPGIFADNCTTMPGAVGPITQRMLDNADVPSPNVPLLADGAPVSGKDARNLSIDTSLSRSDGYGPMVVDAGEPTLLSSDSFCRSEILSIIPQGFPKVGEKVTRDAECLYAAPVETGRAGGYLVLQDTTMWKPVHGNELNLLMADGSVKVVTDLNGDEFINPGLPKHNSPTGTIDGTCEVSAFEVWSGALLNFQIWKKTNFEVADGGGGGGGGGTRQSDGFSRRIAANVGLLPNEPETDSKSWKRVKVAPNTSRLLIGDKDELKLNGVHARVQIDGFRARVLMDCFYYNDRNQQLEGKFKIRLPDDASLYYFAFGQSAFDLTDDGALVDSEFVEPTTTTRLAGLDPREIKRLRSDVWRHVKESRMVPREKAAYAYTQTVRRRVDPALVEWAGAGVFNASVYPLVPKKLHRIVIGYDVDLQETADGLTYTLDLPNSVRQCQVDLDVLELDEAQISLHTDARYSETSTDGVRHFHIDQPRKRKAKPLRLTIAGAKNVALVGSNETANFFAMRTTLDLPADTTRQRERAIFLLDTSLSSQPDKFNVWLRMLEATLKNNRDSMKEFAVLFFDVQSRFWRTGYHANTDENTESLIADCQNIVLEGATDLFAAASLITESDWLTDGTTPDVFLLSDGGVTWGESNLRIIQREFDDGGLGSLFAYQTGMTGSSIANLRFLTAQTGGAVFSVAGEGEVEKASTAHRTRPWRLKSIQCDGGKDVLTAGRAQWVYPGQLVTVVSRLENGAEPDSIEFHLERDGEELTVSVRPDEVINSNLANRLYGSVAVGQLESLEDAEREVATAYARHFRITGATCSLLMLESEADYRRFDIKPEEDEFVVKTTNVAQIIDTALHEHSETLGDPRTLLLSWVRRLEETRDFRYKLPQALRLAIDQIDVETIRSTAINHSPEVSASGRYVKHLSKVRLNYDVVAREAGRRARKSKIDAIKALSSLVEQNPGDVVLARDVAFSSMELGQPEHAYYLLRRVAKARPYDPSIYTAIGQCLTQMGLGDMAIVFYEIALEGRFPNRAQDFRKIAGTEYAFLLRQIVSRQQESNVRDYAVARLKTIRDSYQLETKADLLITMMWNTDQTDVDLHVTEPTGEECFYKHTRTKAGGHITRDITDGFGPEMYVINTAPSGEYDIAVNYFSSNANRSGVRSKVHLTIYRGFGTKSATVTRRVIQIRKPGQKEQVDTVVLK